MRPRLPAWLILGAFLTVQSARGADATVAIAATPSTKTLLAAVTKAMLESNRIRIVVDIKVTSLDALDDLGTGKADIALVTKLVTGSDRARHPEEELYVVPVGMEVVALGVSNDLWDAGVRSISKETMRRIYEQKITNWRDAGGPDEKISFFNFKEGQGIWEIFAAWIYGDNRMAPLPKVQKVNSSEDALGALEFNAGSITLISPSLVDGSRCHALGVTDQGRIAMPVPRDVAAQAYPLVRPLSAVVVDRPTLAKRAVTDFLIGPDGQALIKECGEFGLDAVPKPPAEGPEL